MGNLSLHRFLREVNTFEGLARRTRRESEQAPSNAQVEALEFFASNHVKVSITHLCLCPQKQFYALRKARLVFLREKIGVELAAAVGLAEEPDPVSRVQAVCAIFTLRRARHLWPAYSLSVLPALVARAILGCREGGLQGSFTLVRCLVRVDKDCS